MARKLRRVAIIPSLFTVGNGVCGFASVIVASRIHPASLTPMAGEPYLEAMGFLHMAGWLIFAGMVFDVLDGRIARMSGAASRFGAELDSLCDVVTFGVAPAFLLLKMGPTPDSWLLYRVLFVAATLYVVCTILRLARFNVETRLDDESHRFFNGLPSPAAAGCLAAFAIFRYELEHYPQLLGFDPTTFWPLTRALSRFLPFAALVLAMLMVSSARYPHLVNQSLRGRRSFRHLVALLGVAAGFLLIFTGLSLLLAFWTFAIVTPLLQRIRKRGAASEIDPVSSGLVRPRQSHPELED